MTVLLSLGLTLGSIAHAGGAGAPAPMPKPAAAMPAACMTITDIVGSDPQFSTLLTAVQAAGLEDTLKSGSYTVFAPTNAAFAKVPSDALANLLNDPEMLKSVLLYHVVPGKVNARQVMSLKSAKTANGANVSVRTAGGKVMINTATVTKADVMACNGIVHVIDTVLMPPMAAAPAAPAPTAAATPAPAPAMPEFSVVNIPVTPQPRTTATTTTDTTATSTTTTTTDTTTTATDTSDTGDMAVMSNTVYDVIVKDERFSTLAGLISDAGLDETLMSGDYTIFAPTNEAFDKLDDNTLAQVASDRELLKKVLLYHVVSGKVLAADVVTSTQLASAEGSSLDVTVSGSDVKIGSANVIATDIAADNGVVHAIDAVLLPPDVTVPAADAAPADTTATVTTTVTTAPAAGDMSGGIVATNMTIADVINSDARFSILRGLLQQSGNLLTTALAGNDLYTVFLPTDTAFGKLAPETLNMVKNDPATLARVLNYHVVRGAIKLTDTNTPLATITNDQQVLSRSASGSSYVIGNSTVLYSDIQAKNGYINVVNDVLIPPATK
ncbi:fasciclin domain-containing protein [Deinococcus aquiradiocola]|nr:fasciclin domain-containing protein [Deinococcus aquiradiocola]